MTGILSGGDILRRLLYLIRHCGFPNLQSSILFKEFLFYPFTCGYVFQILQNNNITKTTRSKITHVQRNKEKTKEFD